MQFYKPCLTAFSCLTVLLLGGCNPQTIKSGENSDAVSNPANLINLLDPEITTEKQAFAKAEAALNDGKTDRALFYYVKTLQYNKNNIEAREKIAAIHEANKHTELARDIYKEILSIDKSNAFANENLGLYHLKNGQNTKAKELLTQAVKSNNRAWRSHNGLGVISDLEHNSAEAIAHYEAAAAIEPTNPMLLNNAGYSYYLAGDYNKAKHFFNQALSFNSKYKRAIHNLALIEIKRGAYPTAVALFSRIMSTHEALNNTGFICMLNGQYDVAEEYFKRAIDESPVYFPKAQENLNTLLSLERTSVPYQAPAEEPYQIESNSEIEPAVSVEPSVNPKPALQSQKIEKMESPAAQKSKKAAFSQKEGNQTGKPRQLAAKPDKKKSRPEARPVEKAEVHERNIGKTETVTQKSQNQLTAKAEQKNHEPKPPTQEIINKTANEVAAADLTPEAAQPAPSAEMSNPTEQAKTVESPKPGPALPNAGKPSESTLPASPKENLQAQAEKPLLSEKAAPVSQKVDEAKPETRSQTAESLEQKKVQPLAEANASAPAVAQTPAEPKPVNSPVSQEKIPAQETKSNMPPSDIGNAQQPAAGSEIKAQTQPAIKPDTFADQSKAAPKPKEVPAGPSPIAPVKKKDASGSDADPSHQK